MWCHIAQEIILERTVARLMKTHYDCHHFAQTHARLAPPLTPPCAKQMLMPQRLKLQTEVVNVTEQRYNLHDENLLGRIVWVALATLLKRSLVAHPLYRTQVMMELRKSTGANGPGWWRRRAWCSKRESIP